VTSTPYPTSTSEWLTGQSCVFERDASGDWPCVSLSSQVLLDPPPPPLALAIGVVAPAAGVVSTVLALPPAGDLAAATTGAMGRAGVGEVAAAIGAIGSWNAAGMAQADGRSGPFAGRTEDGYVSGQWKYGQIAFGRVGRNWGPIGLSGLQLGDEAYTYDHLYGKIGTDRIHVSSVAARLENYVLSPGVESSRYFSTHRLGISRGRFDIGFSESFIYTGVGRGLEFTLLNPLNVFGLSWRNERTDGNRNDVGEPGRKR